MAVDPIQSDLAPFAWGLDHPSPGVVAITLSGELDLATVPQLEDALSDAEAAAGRMVVIDLRPLEFMDLAGARSILAADRRVRRNGRELHVVAGPRARRLFRLAGFDGLSILDDSP
jgi:anti-sigma B factor antagonist